MKVGDQVVIRNNGSIIEIAEITGENKREWLVGDFFYAKTGVYNGVYKPGQKITLKF